MKVCTHPTLLATTACVFGLAGLCQAQWTDDPSLNTPVVTANGDQVQPKIAPTADGGMYVSWFDNRTGGYDVYMQRLDANGEPQWQENGILIADRSFSSTQDFGMSIDSDGYAVVAFRDDRSGDIVVTASRVAPDGTQVWGEMGVQPSMTGGTIGQIRVEGTSDGNVAVGWFNGADARVVKLDSEGNELWGTDIGPAPAGGFTVSDLIASDAPGANGEVIVLMTTMGAFFDPRHIYAQKLDADGNTMWTSPTPIFTDSSIQIAYLPTGVADGVGGMVMAWYQTDPLQVRAQRVDADGLIQFAAGGATVSTNAMQLRVDPSAAFDATTNETYVFWPELDTFQNAIGVYGQKFDAAGERQWGDDGAVVHNANGEITQVRTLLHDDGAQVYFAERLSPSNQRLLGALVDTDGGAPSLTIDVFEVSTADSSKSRLAALTNASNQAVLVWQDGRSGNDDLYAQNINADGTLGPVESGPTGDLNGDGVVNVADLLILLANWGNCPSSGSCTGDLNDDGIVNVADMLILLANWG